MKIFAWLILVVICTACNDNSTRPGSTKKIGDTTRPSLNDQINHIDSMEIVYYKNPYGDSVKFSRFFTFNTIVEQSALNLVSSSLKADFTKLDALKNCRSEGKFILHLGNEKFKTVYFSTMCDTCCYLYQIKDGAFHYYQLSDSVKQMIKLYKRNSKDQKS